MGAMWLRGVGIDGVRAQPVMLLQETVGRGRVLPIWIGAPEAGALAMAHESIAGPRPDSHELLIAVVAGFGRRLERVVITALEQSTFHAELVFDHDTRVAARPSDAVIVAVRLGALIDATDVVLDRAGVRPDQVREATDDATDDTAAVAEAGDVSAAPEVDRFRRFLDTATADDFDTDH